MATFDVNKRLCNLIYKNKNTILDSHFNSLDSEEKSQFISVSNSGSGGFGSGKVWDVVSVNSNDIVNRTTYTQYFLQRDTLPIQENITIIGKGKPLIGSNTQPTIKIDCSTNVSTLNNNPNINIFSSGSNPFGN